MRNRIKLSKAQTAVIRRLKAGEMLIRHYDKTKHESRYFFTSDEKTIRRKTLVKLERFELITMVEFKYVELTERGAFILV